MTDLFVIPECDSIVIPANAGISLIPASPPEADPPLAGAGMTRIGGMTVYNKPHVILPADLGSFSFNLLADIQKPLPLPMGIYRLHARLFYSSDLTPSRMASTQGIGRSDP